MKIFRTYDVRGIYPTELNEEIAFNIAKSFATFNPGKIVVGMDVRLSSPSLKKKVIKGLLSVGADVIDIGLVTTPIVIFTVAHFKYDGGIMVTASHNPKEYNGLLFYGKNGLPIGFEQGLNKVKEIFEIKKFAKGKGKVEKKNIIKPYSQFLLNKINIKNKKLKVVIDAGNGSAGLIYPKIIKKLGVKVDKLYCEPDGSFPNRDPEPRKETLSTLSKTVIEKKADIGLAYDADGDRLAIIDEQGNIIEGKKVFGIFINMILEKNPNSKIVYDFLTSKMVEDLIRAKNGIPIVCRVGHTFIQNKLVEEDATLAGELSGHYFFKETYGSDDVLFASLKIIEYLANKKISELTKDFPEYYFDEKRNPIDESKKFDFIEKLKEEFKDYKIDTLDGIKIFLKNGWMVFRPSNTEPKISIAYEAKNKENFEEIKRIVDNIIQRI